MIGWTLVGIFHCSTSSKSDSDSVSESSEFLDKSDKESDKFDWDILNSWMLSFSVSSWSSKSTSCFRSEF